MRKVSLFDLISLSIILVAAIFSAVRFNTLPQFIDGYYHLSVANGFIASGGWVSWAWWDFSPFGRPHLYPPFYHFVLVFLIKCGLSGLNALRLAEVLIVPVFFFVFWYILRSLKDDKFAFLCLSSAAGFFTFYSSVSANVPASLAIIFGLLAWFFLKKKKWVSSAVSMSLCFYSHAGIPWVFFASLLLLAAFNREYRKLSLKAAFTAIAIFLPFILHAARYIKFIHLSSLVEARFISFNFVAMLCAFMSMYFNRRNKDFLILLFWGYFLASAVVFIKYPYRFFSAQGFLGFAFFSAYFLWSVSGYFAKRQKLFLVLISLYLLFINATFCIEDNKIKFNFFDSTFSSLLTKKAYEDTAFKPVFSEKFYLPIVKVIRENSSADDIISSNVLVAAQIFSSLSNRPSSSSMLKEVQVENKFLYSDYAKLIILIKPILPEDANGLKNKKLNLIFENDIAYVVLNQDRLPGKIFKPKPVGCVLVYIIFILLLLVIINDSYHITGFTARLNLYRFFKPK